MNQEMERSAAGIEPKDFTRQPAQLKILELDETKETSLVEITLAEGSSTKSSAWWLPAEEKSRSSASMGPLLVNPTSSGECGG